MYRVTVNPNRCENKQTCLDVCPTDVFELRRPEGIRNPFVRLKILAHGNRIAYAAREADCIGCLKCVEVCPEVAIVVEDLTP